MKETPILYSPDMVRTYLLGKKTMTRRVITPHNSVIGEGGNWNKLDFEGKSIYKDKISEGIESERKAPLPFVDDSFGFNYLHVPYNWSEDMTIYRVYPRYEIGDRLWVKETWATENQYNHLKPSELPQTAKLWYLADQNYNPRTMGKIRASIFMPHWASRITQTITKVRVERLQQITPEDCLREGLVLNYQAVTELPKRYASLWDSIIPKQKWDTNPWCWVYSFAKVDK